MCNPVIPMIIMAAAATAQTVSSIQGANAQVDAADAAAAAQAEEFAMQRDEQIGDRIKEARAAQARMRVAAGEAGVAGNSFEAMLADSRGKVNHDLAIATKQSGLNARRINADLASVAASHRGIGGLNAGLQIAGAAASGYSAGGGTWGKSAPKGP